MQTDIASQADGDEHASDIVLPTSMANAGAEDDAEAKNAKAKKDSEAFIRYRKLARILAAQFLFQVDIQQAWGVSWSDKGDFRRLVANAWIDEDEHDEQPSEKDIEGAWKYAETLIDGVMECHEELDELIIQAAVNWSLTRMGYTDRAILRLASYEILKMPKVKPATAIDEAINLARAFGQSDSTRFVNGVLDKVKRIIQKNKSGKAEDSPVK